MPRAWYEGRVCEEFSCTLTEARREIRRHGDDLSDVIEARAFAAAYAVVQRTERQADLPDSPMVQLAVEIDLAVANAELSGTEVVWTE